MASNEGVDLVVVKEETDVNLHDGTENMEIPEIDSKPAMEINLFLDRPKDKAATGADVSKGAQYKKTYCIFCEAFIISKHFARHLKQHHKKKVIVQHLLNTKGMKERKRIINSIRNKGNFALQRKVGKVIPKRLTKDFSNDEKQQEYSACSNCKGFFKTTYLVRHNKKCLKKRVSVPKRVQCKKTYCLFCETFIVSSHFASHLKLRHKEKNIEQLLNTKDVKERKQMMNSIRNKVNFALQRKVGRVIPKRLTKNDDNRQEYIACSHCKGFFKTTYMVRHKKKCLETGATVDVPKRVQYKKTYCLFCEAFIVSRHFARHLKLRHKEKDIVQLLLDTKDTKERKRMINSVRNKGNFALQRKVGRVIPKRLTKDFSNEENQQEYVACSNCKGFFKATYLARHKKKCLERRASVNIPKRVQYKETYCTFCEAFIVSKHFARHLERRHEEKDIVQRLLNTKDVKERKQMINSIRNKGNFALQGKVGRMIPKRLTKDFSNDENQEEYIACWYCKGFFKATYLVRHMKKCLEMRVSGHQSKSEPLGYQLVQ